MRDVKSGFTLIELLVVIAIIGILSAVAIVNLNSAREKARQANVIATLSQLITAAMVCQDDGKEISYDGTNDCDANIVHAPLAGSFLCIGSTAQWPELETDWIYKDCASDKQNRSWYFTACGIDCADGSGHRAVYCSQKGCEIRILL